MKMIKNLFSAIIFGAVSAVSFIFTKDFITKKLLASKKPVKIAKPASKEKFILDFSSDEDIVEAPIRPQAEQPIQSEAAVITVESTALDAPLTKQSDFDILFKEEEKQEPIIETTFKKTASNMSEFSFYMDYPKCNLPGATSLIYNNMIMVDSDSFTLAFQMDTIFNREKGTLTILFNDNSLIFNLYDKSAKFNNEIIATEQYAVSYNDLLFIPLPLTAEVFGIKVKQNDKDRILQIYK